MIAGSKMNSRTVARSAVSSRAVRAAPFRPAVQQQRPARVSALAVRAAALKVGDNLKDSSEYYRVLRTSDGGSLSLSTLKGTPVVLFFYPKAATPGCTKEACKFRDEFTRFERAGAKVYGISSDSPEDNKAFAQANRLPFPLLTDPQSILRKTFEIPADFLGLLPGRQTYVIDKEGKVILSFNDALNVEGHVDAALKALAA